MVSTLDSVEEEMREEEYWNNISEADRELLMEMNAKNYKPFKDNALHQASYSKSNFSYEKMKKTKF